MSDADIKNTGPAAQAVELTVHSVTSTFDGSQQPLGYWKAPGVNRPVLVFLHSWSADMYMKPGGWLSGAVERGWSFVMPNFRGPNNKPQACASQPAKQDVLDAVEFALKELGADDTRVYLAGGSGGGHMTMVMAGHAPTRFTACVEFCGISDLTAWYHKHCDNGVPKNYANMIALSVGGAPGSSAEVDRELHARSPVFHIHAAKDVPIDFCHGVLDGQTGSVPFRHSIDAFNVIAKLHGVEPVTEEEITQMWEHHKLLNPKPGDTVNDPIFEGREIHMRRFAGPSRLTIFHGGHEAFAQAGLAWLEKHTRKTTGS